MDVNRKPSPTKQYIHDMVVELRVLAEKDGDNVLAMLLQMAALQITQPTDSEHPRRRPN